MTGRSCYSVKADRGDKRCQRSARKPIVTRITIIHSARPLNLGLAQKPMKPTSRRHQLPQTRREALPTWRVRIGAKTSGFASIGADRKHLLQGKASLVPSESYFPEQHPEPQHTYLPDAFSPVYPLVICITLLPACRDRGTSSRRHGTFTVMPNPLECELRVPVSSMGVGLVTRQDFPGLAPTSLHARSAVAVGDEAPLKRWLCGF